MFEALISLTLLAMQPPLGEAGMEWAKEIKSFSSEIIRDNENSTSQLKSKAESKPQSPPSSGELDLSLTHDEASAARIALFLDSGLLSRKQTATAYSNDQQLPSYDWFKKHQNWISIDRRVLKTRGEEALFQDWSPL